MHLISNISHLLHQLHQLFHLHFTIIHVLPALHRSIAAIAINGAARLMLTATVAMVNTVVKMAKAARQFGGFSKQYVHTVFYKCLLQAHTAGIEIKKTLLLSRVSIANHNTGRPPPFFILAPGIFLR